MCRSCHDFWGITRQKPGSRPTRRQARHHLRYRFADEAPTGQDQARPAARRDVAWRICSARSEQRLDDYLELWLAWKSSQVSERTWEHYASLLRTSVIPALGTMRLQDLTPQHLDDFYARSLTEERTAKGLKDLADLRAPPSRGVEDGTVACRGAQHPMEETTRPSHSRLVREEPRCGCSVRPRHTDCFPHSSEHTGRTTGLPCADHRRAARGATSTCTRAWRRYTAPRSSTWSGRARRPGIRSRSPSPVTGARSISVPRRFPNRHHVFGHQIADAHTAALRDRPRPCAVVQWSRPRSRSTT